MSNEVDFPKYFSVVGTADRDAAVEQCVGLVDAGVPVEEILLRLIAPGQTEAGRLWERNEWTVAQEHAATAVADAVLGAVTSLGSTRAAGGRSLVLACVEGEWHSFPARMAAELFRQEGWEVTFLGASTPADAVGAYLERVRPDFLGVSCTIPYYLAEAKALIESAHAVSVPVIAGGRAFGTDGLRAKAVGADYWQLHPLTEMVDLSAVEVAARRDEVGADRLWTARRELADAALEALIAVMPEVATFDERRMAHTVRDFEYMAQYGSATLLTGDDRLFDEFVSWLAGVLEVRGVTRDVLASSLGALARVSAGEHPRMRDMAERGASLLAA